MGQELMIPSYYAIPELARLWGVSEGQVELYAIDGLKIQTYFPDGDDSPRGVRCVTRDEAERFRPGGSKPERADLRADALRNWHFLSGFLICYVMGDGGKRPAELRDEILESAPRYGITLPFSDSWLEKTLREIRERMASHGCEQFIERPKDSPRAQSPQGKPHSRQVVSHS